MESTFFQSLSALQITGEWKIIIQQTAANYFVVSALLCNEQCGDDARKLIPPLILKGTAQELDEGFFNAVEAPVKVTAQLFSNMESYLKQQEQAQLQSKMEKDKATKEASTKTDKEKKYDAAMKKVDELEAEGKYKEAWMKVPEPTEYPEHADTLRKRRESISPKFTAPSLF
jgi:PRTRC genetic system protein E